jgi:hypothetical protein
MVRLLTLLERDDVDQGSLCPLADIKRTIGLKPERLSDFVNNDGHVLA